MAEEVSINEVNRHYLDKVMDLAEEKNVEATEDIYDARGTKLVAKGARITRALQERLILHKLRKPLEASITVAGGVNSDMVADVARQLAESIAPLGVMLRVCSGAGKSPLDILKRARFGNAMSLMLTIIERGGNETLEHSAMVSLLSACLASALGLDETEQTTAALAGLLHDIGQLYIEPELLAPGRRLLPHEWRHVMVHPRIGQMLIQELEQFPPSVAQAVAEHHERFDGGGYPCRLKGREISIAGQVVSVAELMSGVFARPERALERAELALKIIPGEYAYELVSAVSSVLHACAGDRPEQAIGDAVPTPCRDPQKLVADIDVAIEQIQSLAETIPAESRACKDVLSRVLRQVRGIKQAFNSTGLGFYIAGSAAELIAQEPEIRLEAAMASKEMHWQLQKIARNLAFYCASLEAEEALLMQPLIAQLDAAGLAPPD